MTVIVNYDRTMKLFISGFLLCLSLCIDLGIVNVKIIKTGIVNGFKQSFMVGLGSTLGDMIYAILSFFGITLLLKILIVRWILWIMGTGILLYFCYTMLYQLFKQNVRLDTINYPEEKDANSFNFFWTGFGLALSSPSAILWYATIGGSLIASQRIEGNCNIVLFLAGFFFASFVWSIFLAFVSYKGGQVMKSRVKNIVSIASAIMFLILAVYVFVDGYNTLIR